MKRVTTASCACLRAVFGYKIKDISTEDLHKEANILTPNQKSVYDKAVMFWRITNNCEPQELFKYKYRDLTTCGNGPSSSNNQTERKLESSALPTDLMTLSLS